MSGSQIPNSLITLPFYRPQQSAKPELFCFSRLWFESMLGQESSAPGRSATRALRGVSFVRVARNPAIAPEHLTCRLLVRRIVVRDPQPSSHYLTGGVGAPCRFSPPAPRCRSLALRKAIARSLKACQRGRSSSARQVTDRGWALLPGERGCREKSAALSGSVGRRETDGLDDRPVPIVGVKQIESPIVLDPQECPRALIKSILQIGE